MITPVLYSNEQIKAFIFVALKIAVSWLVPWQTVWASFCPRKEGIPPGNGRCVWLCLRNLLHYFLVRIIIRRTMFKFWCGHLLLKQIPMATNVLWNVFKILLNISKYICSHLAASVQIIGSLPGQRVSPSPACRHVLWTVCRQPRRAWRVGLADSSNSNYLCSFDHQKLYLLPKIWEFLWLCALESSSKLTDLQPKGYKR